MNRFVWGSSLSLCGTARCTDIPPTTSTSPMSAATTSDVPAPSQPPLPTGPRVARPRTQPARARPGVGTQGSAATGAVRAEMEEGEEGGMGRLLRHCNLEGCTRLCAK